MGTPPLTDELCRAAADALAEHGTQYAAAEALGIPRPTLQVRLRRAAERGFMGTKPALEGFAIKTISSRSEDGSWVKQAKEPGEVFEVPAGQAVKGVSALVDGEGRTLAKWVKTREDGGGPDLITGLRTAFEGIERAELTPAPRVADDDLLTVYPIADQHLGMLSWGRETGEAYDLKIGVERLRSCATRLIAQAPPSAEALILNLGDWTHNDDSRNMTPRSGHVLDVDGRYQKIVEAGARLMIDLIELALQKHKRVRVRNIRGNHDPHASVALNVALALRYEDHPRVTIDDDPSEWFFHRFGATLIGAHHGHRRKPADMAMTMAVQRREDWGATDFHWFLFGHIHHETAKEEGDVRVESFRTLAGRDANAAGNGYGSGKSLVSITLHREEGEHGRNRIDIKPPRVKRAA